MDISREEYKAKMKGFMETKDSDGLFQLVGEMFADMFFDVHEDIHATRSAMERIATAAESISAHQKVS